MCKKSLEELDVEKLSAYQMHSYSLATAAGDEESVRNHNGVAPNVGRENLLCAPCKNVLRSKKSNSCMHGRHGTYQKFIVPIPTYT